MSSELPPDEEALEEEPLQERLRKSSVEITKTLKQINTWWKSRDKP